MNRNPIDIIIPIYNAADDLEICLESIYKNTDLTQNRLVLINDNSPDPKIKEILDKQQGENIIVIHNENNKGFSANINIGMAQSETNDVILLNSDTVVTNRWVEKMVDCAYSSPEIGTVTPLSNNATLCSVPVFCEENTLPDNINAEQMGELVEHCSMKKYPRISVAHGFCMLVKREVIDLVGNFDAETFGRGYGEENDFCNRAEQVGFIHVQCDDTFILHTGTKSFVSAEKEAYIREHDAILRKRYPLQMHANDVYVRDNPNGFVQENISIFMDLKNEKKNILYVVHMDFRKGASNNVGGTQLHVQHLKDKMVDKYNVFVAARDEEYLNLTLYTDSKEHFWKFHIGEYKEYFRFHDRKIAEVWDLVFDAFNFDVVHVHHVYSLSFDIFKCASDRDIPVILTCHDYFFVSPSLKLLDEDCNIIEKDTMTTEKWRATLAHWANIYPQLDYITLWQMRCGKILGGCDKVIVPNITVKDNIVQYYPEITDKIQVVEHGYEFDIEAVEIIVDSEHIRHYIEKIQKNDFGYIIKGWGVLDDTSDEIEKIYLEVKSKNTLYRIPTSIGSRNDVVGATGNIGKEFKALIPSDLVEQAVDVNLLIKSKNVINRKCNICEMKAIALGKKKLNVAFIGGINKEKGGSIICDLVKKHISGVNYYIFGNIGHEDLGILKADNLYKFDKYDSNDLPKLMSLYKIDIVCVLSIWPETFSYTLSEALLCGVPTIVADTGALGDRMNKLKAGWTVSIENSCNEIADILKSIVHDKSLLEEKIHIVSETKLRDLQDMADEYDQIYATLIKQRPKKYRAFNSEELYRSYMDRKYFIEAEIEMVGFNNGISPEDKAVLNSTTFRIVKRIRGMKIPFRMQLWYLFNRGR